jgi:sensor c-di-GMP phosphodiesterase-like protein
MNIELYLIICLAAITGLTVLVILLRLTLRDAYARSERLRLALLELEMQRVNQRPTLSKSYRARFGGESE